METLFINVRDKAESDLIKKILARFSSVVDFGVVTNKRILKLIEDMEDEEDVRDFQRAQALNEQTISLADAIEHLKLDSKS